MTDPSVRLHWSTLAAYSGITIPLATAGLPIAIFVAPLYTDYVGVPLTAVGLALFACRLVDLVLDPLVGRLSDRTVSRFGRRKPWIALGIPIMMLSTWHLFNPVPGTGAVLLFVWMSLFYLGWTLIVIPYGAWGAELSTDYHERSRIAGGRELASVVGLLLAVTIPVLVGSSAKREGAQLEAGVIATDTAAMGAATIIALPLFAALLLGLVREPKTRPATPLPARRMLRVMMNNKPFLILLGASVVAGVGVGINQTTVIHFYTHRANLPELADVMIFIFFFAALLGVPFWVWLGRLVPKHKAMAASALWGLGFLIWLPFIPPGHETGFMILQFASGLAYAGPLILGASMAADVIDLDWLKSGAQRAAVFIAAWGIGRKMTEAVGLELPCRSWMPWDFIQGTPIRLKLSPH